MPFYIYSSMLAVTLLAPMKRTGMHVSTTSGKERPKTSGKHPEKIEKGREVVKTVCTQLANARIFPTLDSSLLEIVAKHESNFGNDKTDAKGRAPVGGIWRISRPGFDDTVNLYAHPQLEQYYIHIFKAFLIDWSKVDWKTDMDIPLSSSQTKMF